GGADDPPIELAFDAARDPGDGVTLTSGVEFTIRPRDSWRKLGIVIRDNAYGAVPVERDLDCDRVNTIAVETTRGLGWYDLSVTVTDTPGFLARYAGRVETGWPGVSDPAIGRRG